MSHLLGGVLLMGIVLAWYWYATSFTDEGGRGGGTL